MGGMSFFRQCATSTGTFSKLQNYMYLYKLLSFGSTEPIWVTLYTYHQSNNDVTLLQSIQYVTHLENSIWLGVSFFRQRATSTGTLSRLQKNMTLLLLYTIKNNQFFEGVIHTAIIWIGLNQWVTLYTYYQTKLIMMLHFLSHYTRQAYKSLWELHLVENEGSVFLSTMRHFHWHLLQATKWYILVQTAIISIDWTHMGYTLHLSSIE